MIPSTCIWNNSPYEQQILEVIPYKLPLKDCYRGMNFLCQANEGTNEKQQEEETVILAIREKSTL